MLYVDDLTDDSRSDQFGNLQGVSVISQYMTHGKHDIIPTTHVNDL